MAPRPVETNRLYKGVAPRISDHRGASETGVGSRCSYSAPLCERRASILNVLDPDPNDDGNPRDAQIVGRVVLSATRNDIQSDDEVSAYAGMGGQGVMPVPNVYNGWVQKLPNEWKKLLTAKQQRPIP